MDINVNLKFDRGLKNFEEEYLLYYDETNNPRAFILKEEGFNSNENEFFTLGGIGFKKDEKPNKSDLDTLIEDLKLQKNMKELKFKHISNQEKYFLSLISKKRVKVIIDWLYRKNYIIHYFYTDNFYYSIVDIIDSLDHEKIWPENINIMGKNFNGMIFNRKLKNSLFLLIKENKTEFLKLLVDADYPNIIDHQKFTINLYKFIKEKNYGKNVFLDYLKELLKVHMNKKLTFLENNPSKKLISDYASFYFNSIIKFPNSHHTFDQEFVVEEKLIKDFKSLLEIHKFEFKFINSKDEILIQISDIIVGTISSLLSFLEETDVLLLLIKLNKLRKEQKETLQKFQEILLYSIKVSDGFKQSIVCDEFEEKMNVFLYYDFSE